MCTSRHSLADHGLNHTRNTLSQRPPRWQPWKWPVFSCLHTPVQNQTQAHWLFATKMGIKRNNPIPWCRQARQLRGAFPAPEQGQLLLSMVLAVESKRPAPDLPGRAVARLVPSYCARRRRRKHGGRQATGGVCV